MIRQSMSPPIECSSPVYLPGISRFADGERPSSRIHYFPPTPAALRSYHPPETPLPPIYPYNSMQRAVEVPQAYHSPKVYTLDPKTVRAYERIGALMRQQREAAIIIQRGWRHYRSRRQFKAQAKSSRDFKTQIADRLRDYQQRRRLRTLLEAWHRYASELNYVRNTVLWNYRRKKLNDKCFYAWRAGARLHRIIRRAVTHLHKYQTKQAWQRLQLWNVKAKRRQMQRRALKKLHWYVGSNKEERKKWRRWAVHYHIYCCAAKIQAGCRGYLARRRYKAARQITRLALGSKFGIRFLRGRRAKEIRRKQEEDRIIQPVIALALTTLKDFLRGETGERLLESYRRKVKEEQQRRHKAPRESRGLPLFHNRSIVISVNRHTVDVLHLRCEKAAAHLARRKYRKVNPPLYDCAICDEVFIMRALRENHLGARKFCLAQQREEYFSFIWHEAKPIVDLVIARVSEMYY